MTTKLSLFNSALLLCGQRSLASLSEEVEARRLLDHVWDEEDGVSYCLEQGQWFFAMRTILIDYDPSIEPEYGYRRAFVKPSDWVLTSALCADEFFREPLTQYVDEAGYWYSDLDEFYVRYVSSDASYGKDLNKWPESFREYVSAYFASKIILKLSGDKSNSLLALFNPDKPKNSIVEKALLVAKSRCAMAMPTSFAARGSWSSSRMSGAARRDRSNSSSGSLIG